MHIRPHQNNNKPIVDAQDDFVPLNYFNIVKLKQGESFEYTVAGYETCIVPATGTVDVVMDGFTATDLGERRENVWDGEPEGVYVPTGRHVTFTCKSDEAEVFIAGAKFDEVLEPFAVRKDEIDMVQYGSDDTKTHRKIKHILGQKQHDRVGRLLVSELYTVGAGGWSGFPPHKHDTDRLPIETRHDETYNYRFRPDHGSAIQLIQEEGDDHGVGHHVRNGSTICLRTGYHPCVAMPGYEMYYFTILGGQSQRSLKQYFQPEHEYQLKTIPGIMDMVAKFK
jgi:5-deoxy-glucuronate isomerase